MLKLKISKQEFTFPSEWSEVSLRNYIDIVTIGEDKHLSSIDSFIKTLSLLCEKPEFISIANDIPIDNFKEIQTAFDWLKIEPKAPKKSVKSFKIGNEDWTIKEDYNKLTVGESISIELMLKDKKLDLSPLEIAFGVLFRRLNTTTNKPEPLNPDDINIIINEKSKLIKVTDVYNIINFFLRGEKTSSSSSKGYSLSIVQIPKVKQRILPLKAKMK